MIEKRLGGLSPVKLRFALIATTVLIILLSGVGFWFFKEWLATYANSVNSDAQQAEVSGSDIASLQRLKTQLEEDSVAVNRTKNIVADSKSYEYQNQIMSDLNAYANTSGVKIVSYGFDGGAGATPGATASTPAAGTAPAPSGLKSTKITVTVNNPVKYTAIMRFIHSIEANLTKMQLSGVSLRKDAGDTVNVDPLTVEVYIR